MSWIYKEIKPNRERESKILIKNFVLKRNVDAWAREKRNKMKATKRFQNIMGGLKYKIW